MQEKQIRRALYAYGDEITLEYGEETEECKGVFLPLRYKNRMYVGGRQLPNGYYNGSHYIVYLPVTRLEPKENMRLVHFGKSYILRRADMLSYNDERLYYWCVAVPYNEKTEEDYEELGY